MHQATADRAVAEPQAPADRLSLSTPAASAAEARARRRRLALFLALLVGVLLRALQYAVDRSLWLDEGVLVSSILGRGWGGLLQPLDYGQTAPFGFLLLVKAATAALGASEYALRLVPFLAGMAGLALAVPVARRYVSRRALPLAVAIFALAPYMVYYSSEVKQYALDALASLAILAFAAAIARRPRDPRLAAGFCLLGAVAVWVSQPAIFMLAGVGLVLGIRALRHGDRTAAAMLVATAAAWMVSFAGSYLVSKRTMADPAYMREFWKEGFFPLPPRTAADWTWLPRMVAHMFREPMGIVGMDTSAVSWIGAISGLVAFLAGAWWMVRRRPLRAALLLSPLAMVLAASAARLYPFGGSVLSGGRVLVFLIPSLAFVMAEGVFALSRMVRGSAGRLVFAGMALLVLLPSLAYAAFSVPHARAEVKPLLQYVNEHRQPGDVMYVYYGGGAVFRYYGPRYGWSPANSVIGRCGRLGANGFMNEVAGLQGRPRVWLLFAGGTAVDRFDERALILAFAEHLGHRLDDRVAVGASVYLYDLKDGPAQPGRFEAAIPPEPETACRGPFGPR